MTAAVAEGVAARFGIDLPPGYRDADAGAWLPPTASHPRPRRRACLWWADAADSAGGLLLVRQGKEHTAYRLREDTRAPFGWRVWEVERLHGDSDDFAEGSYTVVFDGRDWKCEGSNHSANGRGCCHRDAIKALFEAGELG